ncbi:MAG: L-ribulose-5-phosphate 4-epimerase [Ruminococcus sp.]|nr:L-ribulose-5-phosphate 4-epimerase [Ruminococcus sp.]
MLEKLKLEVYEANMLLVKHNLVTFTWGNVSGIDRERQLIVIKPSGVDYDKLSANDMVVVNMNGDVVEGELRPSTDTKTHLRLYKEFETIGGVCHTHSTYAVAWAQAGKDIPCFGTTHADYFYGSIPCARELTEQEIREDYEGNTGRVIVEAFKNRSPIYVPGVICKSHGPFTWGKDAKQSVFNAVVLEEVAKMNTLTLQINPSASPASSAIQNKHFLRKHGPNAYYGQ